MRHQLVLRPAALALALTLLAVAPLPASAVGPGQGREPSIGYSVRVTAPEAPIFSQADARSLLVGRARSSDMLVVVGKENAWY